MASWLSWLERRPVTAEVVGSSPIGVVDVRFSHLWDLSSAGRASALQAEGHRFEPYRSHVYLLCRRGGTGRRPGLKIPWVVIPVPVRFRSPARSNKLIFVRLAQLDRAFGYGPKGRGFESSNARLKDWRASSLFFCISFLFQMIPQQVYFSTVP